MNCDGCRSRFIDTVEFEKLASSVKYYPELIKKHTIKANNVKTVVRALHMLHTGLLELPQDIGLAHTLADGYHIAVHAELARHH